MSRSAPADAPTTVAEGVRKRNVVIVANNIDEIGGLQRVVHNLAQMFAEAGHDVELVGIVPYEPRHVYVREPLYRTWTLYDEREPNQWRPQRLRDYVDAGKYVDELRRRRMHSTHVEKLRRRLASYDDGIIICSQVWAMRWVAEADPRHMCVITQSHESYEASAGLTTASIGSTRLTRIRRYYRDADLFLLLTQADADKFEKEGFCNVGVMHNPVSFYPERGSDLASRTVVNLGRLHEQKNPAHLVRAFALVAARHPDWQLKMFGDGHLEAPVRRLVEELGLQDNVFLMGPTADPEAELLAGSVFAQSSDFEGLPLVLAEAMACGVPCVAYDCAPGIREIITDGDDGIVVPPRDVEALAEGICRLIEDEQLRRGMGARARANIGRFSQQQILRQWHDVFDYVER